MGRNDETVTFENVRCLKETDLAILCVVDGQEVWLPKSHVHDDSEVFDDEENSAGKLVISEWLATTKGLI